MPRIIRPGAILKPPFDPDSEPEVGGVTNLQREQALSKLPASWRTAISNTEEWPYPDPDAVLSKPIKSFNDFPSDGSVPFEIVPFSEFEPWGKMEDESDRDYELFSHYRASGLSRTQSATARFYGISQPRANKVALRCNWLERVEAWDLYREQVYTTQILEDTKKMAHEHAQLANKGVRALSIAFDKLLEKMDNPSEKDLQEMEELTFRTLFSMTERAARAMPNLAGLERLSRGLPTELTASVVIKENRVVVQSTEELANVVSTLQGVLDLIKPDDEAEIELNDIEDAVLVD